MKRDYQPTLSDVERSKKKDIGSRILWLMDINNFSLAHIANETGFTVNDVTDARFGTLSQEKTDVLAGVLISLSESHIEEIQRAVEELKGVME